MLHYDLIRVLTTVRDRLNRVLESEARDILGDMITTLQESYEKRPKKKIKGAYQRHEIGYRTIDRPLRFVLTNYRGYSLRADVICNLRWQMGESLPIHQELVLRIWSADQKLMYREHLDSLDIYDLVHGTGKRISERVMLRLHFDLAHAGQTGPTHHLQIGGDEQEDEHGWFPNAIEIPRLCHPPFELVLLCQVVLANFFPDRYRELRNDPEWKQAVKSMESHVLKSYYEGSLRAIENSEAWLDQLWNIPFDPRPK
jgi:hypothetical protein